jgi:type IV secretory system VirB3-like protein
MKVYLSLTRPKLKRGAEWKLAGLNGLVTLMLVMASLYHWRRLWVAVCRVCAAGPLLPLGGTSRCAVDGGLHGRVGLQEDLPGAQRSVRDRIGVRALA